MTTRAQALADRFMDAAGSVMLAVGLCPEEVWRAPRYDGRSLADLTYRFALRLRDHGAAVAALVTADGMVAGGDAGIPPDATRDASHDAPESLAAPADCTQQDLLDLLRQTADEIVRAIAGLTDRQLAHRVADLGDPSQRIPLEDAIKSRLIVPTRRHFRRYVALWERRPAMFPSASSHYRSPTSRPLTRI
jgi:hypothetical protein